MYILLNLQFLVSLRISDKVTLVSSITKITMSNYISMTKDMIRYLKVYFTFGTFVVILIYTICINLGKTS